MITAIQQKHCAVGLLTQIMHPSEIMAGNPNIKLNDILRKIAERNGCLLIDTDKAFRNYKGVAEGLIIPVIVHPDFMGYALIAHTVCAGLSESGVIAPAKEWRWNKLGSDARYLHEAGLTSAWIVYVYSKKVIPSLYAQHDTKSLKYYNERIDHYSRNNY